MPTVHTMPDDGTHVASLDCWCCPVAKDPDDDTELSNDAAEMRQALDEPMLVVHNRALDQQEDAK